MSGEIFETLLDELPREKREVIEAFFESVNQKILQNVDLGKTEELSSSDSPPAEDVEDLGEYSVVLNEQDEMGMGAPCPIILADEHKVALCFYLFSDSSDDKSAVFLIDGVTSFEMADNVGGYHHDCIFPPYGYGSVWKKELEEGRKELVFGFHDTSFRTKCSDFSYSVHPSENVEELLSLFVFGKSNTL